MKTTIWNLKIRIEVDGVWSEEMMTGAVAQALRRRFPEARRVDVSPDRREMPHA